MAVYGRLFRMVRVLVRPFVYLKKTPDLSAVPEPAVFICRHRNLRGPVFTLVNLPREVRPWVFSVFCDKKTCYRQFTDYTFKVRLKWHLITRRLISWVLSRLVPVMIQSIGSIPVYRQSLQIRNTFRQTLRALEQGESVIIYPDIDYVSTDDDPGEIYTGFLLIGQLYREATGKNLDFVPIDLDMRRRQILVGDVVSFGGERSYNDERKRVGEAIRTELIQLGKMRSIEP